MDSASDYGSEGWGFESLRGHKKSWKQQHSNEKSPLCKQL
jgi:hypothetical protein